MSGTPHGRGLSRTVRRQIANGALNILEGGAGVALPGPGPHNTNRLHIVTEQALVPGTIPPLNSEANELSMGLLLGLSQDAGSVSSLHLPLPHVGQPSAIFGTAHCMVEVSLRANGLSAPGPRALTPT